MTQPFSSSDLPPDLSPKSGSDLRPNLPVTPAPSRDVIERAVKQGAQHYISSRRALIKRFIDTHYSFKGAWQLNKKALGWDMAKAPANVVWAPIYLLSLLGKKGANKCGWQRTEDLFSKVPAGFRTQVDQEVEWVVYTQFLHLPVMQDKRSSETNLLMEYVLNHPEISTWIGERLQLINALSAVDENRDAIEQKLMRYVDSRKAASEITAALFAASATFASQKSISVGALGVGHAAAGAIAYHSAVSSFAFGNSLGSVYYSVFPASVSTGLLVTVTGGVAAALGVVAAFGGIVADPVQRKLGLHERKLNKLLDSIEGQFIDTECAFDVKDEYVARVIDLIDLLAMVSLRS